MKLLFEMTNELLLEMAKFKENISAGLVSCLGIWLVDLPVLSCWKAANHHYDGGVIKYFPLPVLDDCSDCWSVPMGLISLRCRLVLSFMHKSYKMGWNQHHIITEMWTALTPWRSNNETCTGVRLSVPWA